MFKYNLDKQQIYFYLIFREGICRYPSLRFLFKLKEKRNIFIVYAYVYKFCLTYKGRRQMRKYY